MNQNNIQTTAEMIADKANTLAITGGSGVAVYGWFTLEQWFAFGGLMVAFLSWATSAFFKYRSHKLQEAVVKAQLSQINQELDKINKDN